MISLIVDIAVLWVILGVGIFCGRVYYSNGKLPEAPKVLDVIRDEPVKIFKFICTGLREEEGDEKKK